MPVRVEQMTSEVVAAGGDLPLSEAQIEKLVQQLLQRLADKERDSQYNREATTIRRRITPGSPVRE